MLFVAWASISPLLLLPISICVLKMRLPDEDDWGVFICSNVSSYKEKNSFNECCFIRRLFYSNCLDLDNILSRWNKHTWYCCSGNFSRISSRQRSIPFLVPWIIHICNSNGSISEWCPFSSFLYLKYCHVTHQWIRLGQYCKFGWDLRDMYSFDLCTLLAWVS